MKYIFIALFAIPFTCKGQSTVTYYDQYGQKTGSANIQYNQPVQPTFKGDYYEPSMPDLRMIQYHLAYKQRVYDLRLNSIQAKYNNILKIIDISLYDYKDLQEYYINELTKFANEFNTERYDLYRNIVYEYLYRKLDKIETNLYQDIKAKRNNKQ